jgi:hypothetical protein
MQFLIDASPTKFEKIKESDLVLGQLLTPLTRYSNAGSMFAIDNGAFSRFDREGFRKLLERETANKQRCLFVTVPDIVANARRTMEIWRFRHQFVRNWPLALVAQDGMEDMEIPWHQFNAIFIGGGDPWKDSTASIDIVKTAKTLGKHVHVGRVNQIKRFKRFHDAGADTCDGSGVAIYEYKLADIENALARESAPTFWDESQDTEPSPVS